MISELQATGHKVNSHEIKKVVRTSQLIAASGADISAAFGDADDQGTLGHKNKTVDASIQTQDLFAKV